MGGGERNGADESVAPSIVAICSLSFLGNSATRQLLPILSTSNLVEVSCPSSRCPVDVS